jgi:CBS domain-containing protein
MNVGEICNREVVIITREASIVEAARLMREFHVGDVVVIERRDGENIPVGILTDRDIVVEIVAAEIGLDAANVGDVMSRDVLLASEEEPVTETIKRMKERGVRRLPVVDAKGALQGILSVDDIFEFIAEQQHDVVALVSREQVREHKQRR